MLRLVDFLRRYETWQLFKYVKFVDEGVAYYYTLACVLFLFLFSQIDDHLIVLSYCRPGFEGNVRLLERIWKYEYVYLLLCSQIRVIFV